MYMVAVKGDNCRIILVRHVPDFIRQRRPDWKPLVYSCYAFLAIKPLFRKGPLDTVLFDRDFDTANLQKVQFYLETLLQEYFKLPKRNLVEVGDDRDKPVAAADVLSKQARRGKVKISLWDPLITEEFNLLLSKMK